MKTKIIFGIFLLALFAAGFPLAAQTTVNGVSYIDENGKPATVDNVTKLSGNMGAYTLTGGWYLLSGNFTNAGTLTVSGDVHLILADNCDVTVEGHGAGAAGINASDGNSLTIYGQSANPGRLTAISPATDGAGIGGGSGEACGNITICGGNVNASGNGGGASIGGGAGGAGGNILIYGENTFLQADNIGGGAGGADGNVFDAETRTSQPGYAAVIRDPLGKYDKISIGGGKIFASGSNGGTSNGGRDASIGGTSIGGGVKNKFAIQSNTGISMFGVYFSAKPASVGALSATLPAPINGMQTIPLVSRLSDPTLVFFTTTLGANDEIQFRLDDNGYVNNPVTNTVAQLLAPGNNVNAVEFYKTATDYGLIFDAATGKFYLQTPGNYFGTPLALSGWSWNAATRVLSLNNFSWITTAGIALEVVDTTSPGIVSSITLDLNGDNTFTSGNDQTTPSLIPGVSVGILSFLNLTVTGTGQLNAVGGGTVSASATDGVSIGFITVGNLTVAGGTVNATATDGNAAGLAVAGNLTVAGGTVNATASPDAATGGGISSDQFTFAGGAVTAAGKSYALSDTTPHITAPFYTYWTNRASPSDPGGSGTSVPPGNAYSYSLDDMYVKFVSKLSPVVSLSASGGTHYVNNSLTLTAAISAAGASVTPAPTGAVAFKDGNITLGTASLDNSGAAVFTVSAPISEGSHSYTAEYSGDSTYLSGVSKPCTVDVLSYLSVSPTALNFIAAGETKTFTVTCNLPGAYWTLGNPAPWLTISSGGDDHTMLMKAAANPTAEVRYALVVFSIPGVMSQSIAVMQDAADKTAIESVGAPSVVVYSQNGDVIVKSDVPVQSVAVYDVSGKVIKAVNGIQGFNGSITISGLPKQQALIVRVATQSGIRNYETIIN